MRMVTGCAVPRDLRREGECERETRVRLLPYCQPWIEVETRSPVGCSPDSGDHCPLRMAVLRRYGEENEEEPTRAPSRRACCGSTGRHHRRRRCGCPCRRPC